MGAKSQALIWLRLSGRWPALRQGYAICDLWLAFSPSPKLPLPGRLSPARSPLGVRPPPPRDPGVLLPAQPSLACKPGGRQLPLVGSAGQAVRNSNVGGISYKAPPATALPQGRRSLRSSGGSVADWAAVSRPPAGVRPRAAGIPWPPLGSPCSPLLPLASLFPLLPSFLPVLSFSLRMDRSRPG